MITVPELLSGAMVIRAWRVGFWLCMETTKGRVDVAAGRVRTDLMCPRCQECRLVEIVTDSRGQQGVCAVCAHAWWIQEEPQAVGQQGYVIPEPLRMARYSTGE